MDKDEIPNKNESTALCCSTPVLTLGTIQQGAVSSCMNKPIVIYGMCSIYDCGMSLQ